jgi:CBS domain containing-hemolysin-like protein
MDIHLGLLLVGLLVAAAYCAAGEAAWRSIIRSPLPPSTRQRLGVPALDPRDDPHRVQAVTYLAHHCMNIAAVAVATLLALRLTPAYALALGIPAMTIVLLLVSEVLPGRIAGARRAATARLTLPLVWLSRLLRPADALLRRLPAEGGSGDADTVTEAELLTMVEAVHGGDIKEREKQLIHNIFEFDDTRVSEIMTPRADMFVVDVDRPLDLETIFRSNFSRIPVIDGDIDRIIGILNLKDLLLHQCGTDPIDLRVIMREPYFVPEHKTLDLLLQGFKRRQQHMAIVVDEHGGVSGLITLEDALEELVGEISDETDTDEPTIVPTRPGEWRVKGKAEIDDVNAVLRMRIPDTGEYDTFSGYILSQIGRIPRQAEELAVDGFSVTVTARAGNRILEYLVRLRPAPAADGPARVE